VEVVLIEEGVAAREIWRSEIGATDLFIAGPATFTTSATPGSSYTLEVRVWDSVGTSNRTDNGSRTWSTAPTGLACLPVIFSPSSPFLQDRWGWVTIIHLSSGTSGADIYYTVGPIGASLTPTTLYTGHIDLFQNSQIVAFARKTSAGLSDSPTSSKNYYKSGSGGARLP
jgi:hypothetical protein